jgi:hypothetical protein
MTIHFVKCHFAECYYDYCNWTLYVFVIIWNDSAECHSVKCHSAYCYYDDVNAPSMHSWLFCWTSFGWMPFCWVLLWWCQCTLYVLIIIWNDSKLKTFFFQLDSFKKDEIAARTSLLLLLLLLTKGVSSFIINRRRKANRGWRFSNWSVCQIETESLL